MSLNSISPIDGRYEKSSISTFSFLAKGLMHYRLMVEGECLIALSKEK